MTCEICNEHFGFYGMKYMYREYYNTLKEYGWESVVKNVL